MLLKKKKKKKKVIIEKVNRKLIYMICSLHAVYCKRLSNSLKLPYIEIGNIIKNIIIIEYLR